MVRLSNKTVWAVTLVLFGLLVVFLVFQVVTDAATWRFVRRLYQDKAFLKATVEGWGWMGPVVFMIIQALQVIISPVPGEVTGVAGGFLFGAGPGFFYSTIGLTGGTLAAFGLGRWLGAPVVRRLVAKHYWEKMGFIVEAEGAILAFVLYLFPGFPKDILSYLFGLSPVPFWVFATVSTLGRMPGTWLLSAQGGKVAAGQLRELALLLAIVAAVVIPVYYYRHRLLAWLRGNARSADATQSKKGLTKSGDGS